MVWTSSVGGMRERETEIGLYSAVRSPDIGPRKAHFVGRGVLCQHATGQKVRDSKTEIGRPWQMDHINSNEI